MDKSQIKTIGFSLLRQPGEFELELEYIKAVNTDLAIGDYDIHVQSDQTKASTDQTKASTDQIIQ